METFEKRTILKRKHLNHYSSEKEQSKQTSILKRTHLIKKDKSVKEQSGKGHL